MDSYNHTGYAQVFVETRDTSPEPQVTAFTIGDDIITQATYNGTTSVSKHLLYDGHGSTRQLVDASEGITDYYSYDAYGVMLGGNPGTPQNPGSPATNLLYAGEQFDADMQQYYLRARYYDPLNGRFNRIDPFAGSPQDPQSLHKYLYCHANPINNTDPTGEFTLTLGQFLIAVGVIAICIGILLLIRPGEDEQEELSDEKLTVEVDEAITEGFEKLKEKSNTAKNLVNELIPYINAKKMRFTVAKGSRGNKWDEETHVLTYDPEQQFLYTGEEKWHHRPPEVGLAHELIHAWRDIVEGAIPDDMGKTRWWHEEQLTIGLSKTGIPFWNRGYLKYTENKIRADYGIERRPEF